MEIYKSKIDGEYIAWDGNERFCMSYDLKNVKECIKKGMIGAAEKQAIKKYLKDMEFVKYIETPIKKIVVKL